VLRWVDGVYGELPNPVSRPEGAASGNGFFGGIAFAACFPLPLTNEVQMSRYVVPLPNDERVVYGFDRILQYYFVDHIDAEGEPEALVGLMSGVYGSAVNALECLTRLNCSIPPDHLMSLYMDLPFQDTDGVPEPIPTPKESAQ